VKKINFLLKKASGMIKISNHDILKGKEASKKVMKYLFFLKPKIF